MIKLGTIGKIIITENLKKQIDYYHKKIGAKEWSGTLFFNHTKGNIHKLKDLEFTATNLYLMDIGSATFTNFENGPEVVKAFDCIGDTDLSSLRGFIHSHQTMAAFFSGTDVQELVDNAPNYGFYISLVVNMSEEYVCKIIFPTETQVDTIRESTIRDANGIAKKVKTRVKSTKTEFLDGDLEIVFETINNVEEWVANRISEITAKKEAARVVHTPVNNNWRNNSYNAREDKYWKNSSSAYTPSENKYTQFAKAILLLEEDSKLTLQEAISQLMVLNDGDFEDLKFMALEQLEIFHYNIFKTHYLFETNLNKTILVLEEHSDNSRCGELINLLEQAVKEGVV